MNAIILVLLIDTVAVQYIDDIQLNVMEFSKLLAAGSLSFLVVGIVALLVPWRAAIGLKQPFRPVLDGETETIDPVLEPRGFMGGWFQGGLLEAYMFVSAILLAIHSSALLFAENRQQASYVLAITTLSWTLLATVVLRRALRNNEEAKRIAVENDLKVSDEISYSDDEQHAQLLVDDASGLRGRPDQIVIIDGEFIPVEQKTGKSPNDPTTPTDSRCWPMHGWSRSPPAGHLRTPCFATVMTTCTNCRGTNRQKGTRPANPCGAAGHGLGWRRSKPRASRKMSALFKAPRLHRPFGLNQ